MVLGHSGELGSRLVIKLLNSGHEVIGISRSDKYKILHPSFSFYSKDLLNPSESLDFSRFQPDVLIFLSWITKPKDFLESTENLLWVETSIKIISDFEKFGGKYLIMSGSCAEYSSAQTEPISETSLENPLSLYGKSKLQVLNWLRTRDIPFLWTRTFYQFGLLEESGRLIPSLIDSLAHNQKFVVSNQFDKVDFVYIEDVAEILFILFTKNANGVYNIGAGVGHQIKDTANLVLRLMGAKSELLSFKDQRGDFRKVVSNPKKLISIIGDYKWSDFEETLVATIISRTALRELTSD